MSVVDQIAPSAVLPPNMRRQASPAPLDEASFDEVPPGDEPLPLVDGDSAAWLMSLGIHLGALSLLAVLTLALPRGGDRFELKYEPIELVEEETLTDEFLASDEVSDDLGQLSQAGEDSALAAAVTLADQSWVVVDTTDLDPLGELPAVELETEIFQGPEASEKLLVQGAGSVGTSGARGAVDRITREILTSLQQRKTLVVWLFDESGSLKDEREAIIGRFEKIYDELGVIEAADNPAFRRHKDKPLLTAVVSFGSRPTLLTPKPTDELPEIIAAVHAVAEDENDPQRGVENVFTAVGMAAEKFHAYRSRSQGQRNVMLVVFTDESGNDLDRLDEAVAVCRKWAMPVYVVGRPAPFGRQTAYVKWIDPDPNFDQRPQWVPVDLGPESLLPERLKLRFIGQRNDEDELLDSGFGPYALTRLCYETGGLYFSAHPNRTMGRRVSAGETDNLSAHITRFFDPAAMRRYQPDYLPVQEYRQLIESNAARRALVEAAQMSWTSQMQNVRMRFPKRDEASLARALSEAQRSAALLQPKIDRLCQVLLTGEKDRDKLTRPRWQAGYDLALGRALAVKARTDGYNVMLAAAKQGMPFEQKKNNVWTLQSAGEFANSSVEKAAEMARDYLERTRDEHPGTPWAILAERELAEPLGWKWTESYRRMRPVNPSGGNNRPRPESSPPKRPPRRTPPPL